MSETKKAGLWIGILLAAGAAAQPALAIEEIGNQAEIEAASSLKDKPAGAYGGRVCTFPESKTLTVETPIAARLQDIARQNPKEFGAVLHSGDEVKVMGLFRESLVNRDPGKAPKFGRVDYLLLEGTRPDRCYLVRHSIERFHVGITTPDRFLRGRGQELASQRCLGRRNTDSTGGADGPRSPRTLNGALGGLGNRLIKAGDEAFHRDPASPLVSASFSAGTHSPTTGKLSGGNIVRLPEYDCQQLRQAAALGKAFDERERAPAPAPSSTGTELAGGTSAGGE